MSECFWKKGANVSILSKDQALSALYLSARHGHVVVTKILTKACADLEARTSDGHTPLHLAAGQGHWEVVMALIEAGATVDPRMEWGETPLYSAAAVEGHVEAVRVLLRANANPLTTRTSVNGVNNIPLDAAAGTGHLDVVCELVQQFGIEGCGGTSGGVDALCQASWRPHFDIMTVLADAGVVGTGNALPPPHRALRGPWCFR